MPLECFLLCLMAAACASASNFCSPETPRYQLTRKQKWNKQRKRDYQQTRRIPQEKTDPDNPSQPYLCPFTPSISRSLASALVCSSTTLILWRSTAKASGAVALTLTGAMGGLAIAAPRPAATWGRSGRVAG